MKHINKRIISMLTGLTLLFTASASAAYTAADIRSASVSEASPTEYYILGDADGSGSVDALDATYIQKQISDVETGIDLKTLMNGDIDGNGELEVTDSTFILRWCAQFDVPYEQIGQSVPCIQEPEVVSDGTWVWPTPGYFTITSYYGEGRSYETHQAVDIGAPMETPVYAANSGTVVSCFGGCTHVSAGVNQCSCGGGYGNYIWILHNNGYETIYAHLSSTAVSLGTYVSAGQLIGYVGSSGWSTGPHLHFELRVNGIKANPLLLY